MRNKLALVCTLSVLAVSLGLASDASLPPKIRAKAEKAKGRSKAQLAGRAPHVLGTITYDTGTGSGFLGAGGGATIGNRFNSDMGGPLLMTGNVTMVTFWPWYGGNVGVTVFGPPNTMGTASNLGSFFITGVAAFTFNVATITPLANGPDFLVGVKDSCMVCTSGVILGGDTMTVGGQGFHGFVIQTNFPGGAGTGFAPIAGRNAKVRATGNILVPVELMNFSVQ